MAGLTRITVSEALTSRDYPLFLRDRRLRWPLTTVKTVLFAAAALSIALNAVMTQVYGTRATQTLLTEFILGGAWLLLFGLLYALRIESDILLTAGGMEFRRFGRVLAAIEWTAINSISPTETDVFLTYRDGPSRTQALLAGVLDVTPGDEAFGATIADVATLLETHRTANTTADF